MVLFLGLFRKLFLTTFWDEQFLFFVCFLIPQLVFRTCVKTVHDLFLRLSVFGFGLFSDCGTGFGTCPKIVQDPFFEWSVFRFQTIFRHDVPFPGHF